MANHLSYINDLAGKTLKQVEKDWERCSQQLDEARESRGAYPLFRVLGYTEQHLLIKGITRSIHRVFIQANDSGAYEKLGWALREDASCCMVCAHLFESSNSLFSVFDWSHNDQKLNCHACGNVICKDCVTAAVVTEIGSEGPLPVCSQCSFGQEEVSMVPSPALPVSYKLHQKLQAESGQHKTSIVAGGVTSRVQEGVDLPRVWKYGPVALQPSAPVFSITAHTTPHNKHKHSSTATTTTNTNNTSTTTYYINFLSSVHVPYNLSADCALLNTALTKKSQELMLLVSERSGSSDHSGVYVYDVTLHPAVFSKCSEDSSGVLKEKICAEVLRSIVRLGLEPEFTLFTFNTTSTSPSTTASADSCVYKHRVYSVAERVQRAGDIEVYHRNSNKVHLHHTSPTSNKSTANSVTCAPTPTTSATPTSTPTKLPTPSTQDLVYTPMPSIATFFHMEQVHILYTHLQRPAGSHSQRWAKYSEITQLSDGTVHIPSNKRVRKSGVVVDIPVPVLVECTMNGGSKSSDSSDKIAQLPLSYSINVAPHNGFVINTTRVYDNTLESVVVHVQHCVYVDNLAHSCLLRADLDDTDPLVLVCKQPHRVRNVYASGSNVSGSSGICMAYNVVVGSSYIEGVHADLTGRRIVAPERIDKILRRLNAVCQEHLNVHKYTLTGIEARPITAPANRAVYVYDRLPRSGSSVDNSHRANHKHTSRHVRHSSGDGSVLSDLSDSRSNSIDYTHNSAINSTTAKGKKIRTFFPSDCSIPDTSGNNPGIADRESLRSSHSSARSSGSSGSRHSHNQHNHPSPVPTITLTGPRTPLSRTASHRVPVSPTIAEYIQANSTVAGNANTSTTGRPPSSRSKSINLLAFSLRSSSTANTSSEENIHTIHTSAKNSAAASPIGTPRGTPPPSPRMTDNTHYNTTATGISPTTNTTSGISRFIPPPLLHRISNSSTSTHSSQPSPSSNTKTPTPAPVKRENNADIPGDKMVTLEMLQYDVHSSVNRAVAEGINKQSLKEPKSLFGWQIRINDTTTNTTTTNSISSGVYVVSCVARKGVVRDYEFRLTSVSGDVWVKLQRGGEGEGYAFVAVRKVMVADD